MNFRISVTSDDDIGGKDSGGIQIIWSERLCLEPCDKEKLRAVGKEVTEMWVKEMGEKDYREGMRSISY
jgi:hypothetical protein